MEKHRQEESGLFAAPFAVSLSPVLFSEEEDSEYDFLNPADRQENTIVLFRNDRSAVHCMSSEDSPSPTPTYVYKPGDRSHSPSCTESEEETELSYNSPTLLLEISSSSSSTSVPEESHFTDNYKEQVLAFGAWIKSSSDSSSDCECNNCNPQSIRESKYDENIPSVRMSPHDQMSSEDSPSPTPTYVYKPGDRSHSPSCTESEEETELSYNSPTLLLEISSSSSSTSVPEESHFTDNYKEQVLAFGAWIKSSSDSSSDCECNNCNPQSIRESKYDENIPSVRMSPHDQEAIDNSIYKYNTFSMEMIQAAHSLKYPAEVNKWAAEYLNHQGIKISSTEEMSVTS